MNRTSWFKQAETLKGQHICISLKPVFFFKWLHCGGRGLSPTRVAHCTVLGRETQHSCDGVLGGNTTYLLLVCCYFPRLVVFKLHCAKEPAAKIVKNTFPGVCMQKFCFAR